MDLTLYQTLTGITVSSADQTRVTARILQTRYMLEQMLGYTLDASQVGDNHYVEFGKTALECPCSFDRDTLEAPDAVVGAYRIYSFNPADIYLRIDPASAIHAVKLIHGDVTVKTFEDDEYRIDYSPSGIIQNIVRCEKPCSCGCNLNCRLQLAVDATWLWSDSADIPQDLLYLWADMVTYYSDEKNNIKSQTLGSHSYTKFSNTNPENEARYNSVLMQYFGGNGSLNRTIII